jgi:ParB-like chromosome segregation protein Spo0J
MLKKIKLKDLVPFDRNPRKNKDAIDRVLESLKSNGYISPIVVCEIDHPFKQHVIAAGHTRFEALKKFGAKEVNCFVHKFDSEAQFVRYNIEDNKTAEFADWDEQLLADLGAEFEIDLDGMGFDLDDMAEVDYSALDDDGDSSLNDMADEVRKSIKIDFKSGDFEKAKSLVDAARAKGVYVGEKLIESLQGV